LPTIIFGVVDILESEHMFFSSLSSEENEDKASKKGFLKAKEAKTLLKEYLAIQQV